VRTALPKCLVNGKKTPGSEWESECPLLREPRRSSTAQLAALRQANEARRRRKRGMLAGAEVGGKLETVGAR